MLKYSLRVLTCIFLFLFSSLDTFSQRLSENAQISVLVAGKGPGLYQSWGHAAILVEDPDNRIFEIYNYGTFDFRTPNFYLKFGRGKLLYFLAREPYQNFLRVYQYYNMSMNKLVLNLEPAENEEVYAFILDNLKEENRYYLYDFFFDNCATRIKDLLKETLGDELHLTEEVPIPDLTFRQAIDIDLQDRPWTDFGIDLILGSVIDEKMTVEDYTFHPTYMGQIFKESQVQDSTGAWRSLVKGERRLIVPRVEESSKNFMGPSLFNGLLLLMIGIITFLGAKRNRISPVVDIVLFSVVGLAGIVMAFMWFGTDHDATADNYNILWALPSHVIAAFFLRKKELPSWMRSYLWITAILLIGIFLLVVLGLFPQEIHPAVHFIMAILLVRVIFRLNIWRILHRAI